MIINCAAAARMKECEKNPNKAIKINVIGTLNLVREIINYEINFRKKIRLIHISTDGVYPSINGNYSENGPLKPYNVYGWTKLCSESIVKKLKNYVVIRTKFFDKTNIRFNTAATDIYTSMIEIQNLVKEIKNISSKNFIGIINIGAKKKSDFENYKKYSRCARFANIPICIRSLHFHINKQYCHSLREVLSL